MFLDRTNALFMIHHNKCIYKESCIYWYPSIVSSSCKSFLSSCCSSFPYRQICSTSPVCYHHSLKPCHFSLPFPKNSSSSFSSLSKDKKYVSLGATLAAAPHDLSIILFISLFLLRQQYWCVFQTRMNHSHYQVPDHHHHVFVCVPKAESMTFKR